MADREKRICKRDITKIQEKIKAIFEKGVSQGSVTQIQCELEELVKERKKFDEIQKSIYDTMNTTEATYDKKEEEWCADNDEVREIYVYCSTRVRMFQDTWRAANNNKRESLTNQSMNGQGETCKTKLPRIEIPKFNGDLRYWHDFENLFTNIVINDPDIPDIRKLYYLRDAMKGEAAELIKDFTVSNEHFYEAWDMLKERYCNKRAIIKAHLKDIFSLKKIKKETEIRKLLDDMGKSLRALKALGEPVDSWSTILSYWLGACLDADTEKEWEKSVTDVTKFPPYETLRTFLNNYSMILAVDDLPRSTVVKNEETTRTVKKFEERNPKLKTFATTAAAPPTKIIKCFLCRQNHYLESCEQFQSKTPEQRFEVVKLNKLCVACFSSRHTTSTCERKCRTCNKKHHVMLHRTTEINNEESRSKSNNSGGSDNILNSHNFTLKGTCRNSSIVLPTAVVWAEDVNKRKRNCRALLDAASQATFVTEELVKKMKLPYYKLARTIGGIGDEEFETQFACTITLQSRFSNFRITIEASIKDKISYKPPNNILEIISQNNRVEPIAEMQFQDGKVDILIGAEYVERCYLNESDLTIDPPVRNTRFGWAACGPCPGSVETATSNCFLVVNELLTRFWDLERVPYDTGNKSGNKSNQRTDCEKHFVENYVRNEEGRFVIRLPFHRDRNEIGESRSRALKCLLRAEKHKNMEVREQYVQFMQEYIDLGHMSIATDNPLEGHVYYLPHHSVIKETSTTTRTRVVFNASAKSSTGVSLNDCLMVGPTIQEDLFTILIRFRSNPVAFTCDIKKMYRQVLVAESDRDMQRILWRSSRDDDVKEYRLNTLTYGTVPASFIATKCLSILADELEPEFPSEAVALRKNFYMDDFMSGANSVAEAETQLHRIHDKLQSAGFPLCKYMSNSMELLESIEPELIEDMSTFDFSKESFLHVMGLIWCPKSDTFRIRIKISDNLPSFITKRFVLSEISRVFDPLGFISPVTVRSKLLMQSIWKENKGWDEELSETVREAYVNYRSEISQLRSFSVTRPYSMQPIDEYTELHGFSDASEVAYAAVLYLVNIGKNGEVVSNIVCAKSRVAPLGNVNNGCRKEGGLTVPKLELCGAVMLTELLDRVRVALGISIDKTFAYSDSQIVLCWLQKGSNLTDVFVRNRVEKIVESVPANRWSYVNTSFNPADLATRGIKVTDFLNKFSSLWIFGPVEFLRNREVFVPPIFDSSPIICGAVVNLSTNLESEKSMRMDLDLVNRFSSYNRLIRVVALILRKARKNICKGALEIEELDNACYAVIRIVQRQYYGKEILCLMDKKNIPRSSSLLKLDPFLDENELLRVGGRLTNSLLLFNYKYPIVIPAKDKFAELYIRHIHFKYYHASYAYIINFAKQRFWFVGGVRNIIKKLLHYCIRCSRLSNRFQSPMMADLPAVRVVPNRPFFHVGVDFAGPFDTKQVVVRSTKIFKSYVALFVCLSVKAVHIEMVSELTTAAFLAAFRRFTARRGVPALVYSDNGGNFQGFARYLRDHDDEIKGALANEGVEWRFITSRAPHKGGIWESAIKSAKHHFKKATNNKLCSFEEYSTLFAQVEAVMNSRPLSPIHVADNTFETLTPAHFLIGAPMTALPDAREEVIFVGYNRRWHSIQQMFKSFWAHWHKDYLSILQTRNKWALRTKSLKEGDVVIIREDNMEPYKWPMGLVLEAYLDAGGDQVRSVKLRTKSGIVNRSVNRLILLEIPADDKAGSVGALHELR